MKIARILPVLLLVCVLTGLVGCSAGTLDRTAEQDREQLEQILGDVAQRFQTDSDSSAAGIVTELLAWAAATKMDKQEAADVVMNWLREQSPELRQAFQEQMEQTAQNYGQKLQDGAAELLDAMGIERDMSNLGSRLKEILGEILASGGLDK